MIIVSPLFLRCFMIIVSPFIHILDLPKVQTSRCGNCTKFVHYLCVFFLIRWHASCSLMLRWVAKGPCVLIFILIIQNYNLENIRSNKKQVINLLTLDDPVGQKCWHWKGQRSLQDKVTFVLNQEKMSPSKSKMSFHCKKLWGFGAGFI